MKSRTSSSCSDRIVSSRRFSCTHRLLTIFSTVFLKPSQEARKTKRCEKLFSNSFSWLANNKNFACIVSLNFSYYVLRKYRKYRIFLYCAVLHHFCLLTSIELLNLTTCERTHDNAARMLRVIAHICAMFCDNSYVCTWCIFISIHISIYIIYTTLLYLTLTS